MTAEERRIYMQKYYEENKVRLKLQRRIWYMKNADRIASARRIKYHTDPDFRQYEIERSRAYQKRKKKLK